MMSRVAKALELSVRYELRERIVKIFSTADPRLPMHRCFHHGNDVDIVGKYVGS
jgi:hypothetical protein